MDTTTVSTAAPATNTTRAGRLRYLGLATGLVLGPLGLLVTNFLYTMMTRDGGSDETGTATLALVTAHPTAARWLVAAGLVGAIMMVPAALGAMRLIGQRSARLGFIGATMVAAGYICYFGIILTNAVYIAMAEHGGPVGDFAAVIDATEGPGPGFWVFPVFVLGNLVGTFILGLALLRSKVIPAWAAAGVMAWPPLHILGLFILGNEWPEVAGAAIQLVSFTIVAARLRRH